MYDKLPIVRLPMMVSNCPPRLLVFKLSKESNCPRCQIVLGVKLSAVSNCPITKKTCEDGQLPLLLGVPSHAVQNPPQAASSSQPGESLWRGVLEILSGFFPQLKDGKNNEQARREMLMVTKMIMMSSLQRARELL